MGFKFGHDLGINTHWRGIDPLHDVLRQYFDLNCLEALTLIPVNCVLLLKVLRVLYQNAKAKVNL